MPELSPVAISAIFCPAESPGGAGGISYTAACGILLQLTQIIASGTARVLLNQGGIGMPYVGNFRPQAYNSAVRREKNRSQNDSCDPRGGIAWLRGSAPR